MLTNKQKTFVQEYLVDLNASKAAERAGYSAKTAAQKGSFLLTVPEVAKAIQSEMDKRAEKTGITAEYVLNGIKDTIEECLDNPTAKLKGYELLGKHLKLFTDKVEHSGAVGFNLNVIDDTTE